MTYVLAVLAVIWICGLIFVTGQYLNDLRVVLNNVLPGAQLSLLLQRPNWARNAAGVVSVPTLEGLVLAGAALTVGRVFKLDHLECRISKCNPACLTEAGRLHLNNVARHERFALAWMLGGVAAVVLLSTYSSLG
jgi:hypothetical protein